MLVDVLEGLEPEFLALASEFDATLTVDAYQFNGTDLQLTTPTVETTPISAGASAAGVVTGG